MLQRWNVEVASYGPSRHDENSSYLIHRFDSLAHRYTAGSGLFFERGKKLGLQAQGKPHKSTDNRHLNEQGENIGWGLHLPSLTHTHSTHTYI